MSLSSKSQQDEDEFSNAYRKKPQLITLETEGTLKAKLLTTILIWCKDVVVSMFLLQI